MNQFKKVSVLITGATGYIGSQLTKRLVKEGSDVHLLVRPSSNTEMLTDVVKETTTHIYEGSYQSMEQAIQRSKPKIVFHLASFASIRYQTEDVPKMVESNIVMGAYLAEAMAKQNVRKLVNTSSFSQHMDHNDYLPNSLYAATKQAFEDLICYYTTFSMLDCTSLVLFDNYGLEDPRPKLMNLLYETMKEGTTLRMSPGEQYLDLLYIDDVINAYLVAGRRLLTNEGKGLERFTVGNENRIQLKKLVLLVKEITKKQIRVEWGALDYRAGEIMVPWNKGTPLPGWKQNVSLEEGIRRFFKTNE
ncbi:NAD-dependent epimerase/dehydratase family protein [Bacillus suaedae]|uniref:NAD(P)-dependent oxidoreductase n=1 Tax=Halalkalibacter suaedae TaxID=2822140 RepID=A0A941ANY5_9BACI|nr:NAD(P)-dependent oxidoreductase [Bacillus suaedae]MBP3950877.1 NAD(P)-dependent oxidoreductase [Bacillus suaedae]